MKKNLLTFLFVIVLVCAGALVVSAKNTSSSANSVAVSKRVLVANTKAKSLEARCENNRCGFELRVLLELNAYYEQSCAPLYLGSCEPRLADAVIQAGDEFEQCLDDRLLAKNIDRTIDRNKREKSRDVKS